MRSTLCLIAVLACAGGVAVPAMSAAQSAHKRPGTLPAQTGPGPRVLATPLPTPGVPGRRLLSAEEMQQQRRVAKCKATGGNWTIVVRPMSMTASGSDVDELYGSISAVAGNQGGAARSYHSSRAESRDGGRVRRLDTNIWFSPENANVGRDGGQGLATITIGMRGQVDQRAKSNAGDGVTIDFDVKDEDDGRGGGNDESFTVTSRNTPGNGYRIATAMPSCDESPNFTRDTRITIHARSNGNNRISLNVHVRWFRDTGI